MGAPEVEDVLASWESNGAALREVSTLCRSDEQVVDPYLLALGRGEMANIAETTWRHDLASSPLTEGGPA